MQIAGQTKIMNPLNDIFELMQQSKVQGFWGDMINYALKEVAGRRATAVNEIKIL